MFADEPREVCRMTARSNHRVRGMTMTLGAAIAFAGVLVLAGCAAGNGARRGDGGAPAAASAGPAAGAETSGVQGTVYSPAEGVYIYVYAKGADPHGPAYVILPAATLKDGAFKVDL